MLERQDITAYQGASYIDSIILKDKNTGNILHLSEGDKLVFGIRPHYSDECIIERILTLNDERDNTYPINITPEEMEIEPDEYKYDVGLQTADGDFIKIIPESSFNVIKSTTHKQGDGD